MTYRDLFADDLDAFDAGAELGEWNGVEQEDLTDQDYQDAADAELAGYAELLRGALREDLADIDAETLEEALASTFDAMTPAESFNLGKAFQQIGRTASQVVSDPAFAQIAGTALPLVAGAVGTIYGGPAGGALGSSLGTALAKAIPTRPTTSPTRPPAPPARLQPPGFGPAPPASTGVPGPGLAPSPEPPGAPGAGTAPGQDGSNAALQALLLGNSGLLGTLAAALGPYGRSEVNGVPVASLMRTMSSLYGKAAADADQLLFLQRGDAEEATDDGPSEAWSDGAVYTALLDAENDEFADVWGPW